MVAPVVPSPVEVGKNKIVHKPTKAAFSFDTGDTTFKSVNGGYSEFRGSIEFVLRKVRAEIAAKGDLGFSW
jgi:hypothetical protein